MRSKEAESNRSGAQSSGELQTSHVSGTYRRHTKATHRLIVCKRLNSSCSALTGRYVVRCTPCWAIFTASPPHLHPCSNVSDLNSVIYCPQRDGLRLPFTN